MPLIRLWRRELIDGIRYLADGSNLSEVQALAGDGNWMLDDQGVLWVRDILGDLAGGAVPVRRMPRGWWLIRGPWPELLTSYPPLWIAANFRTETDVPAEMATPAKTLTPTRDTVDLNDFKIGRREAALWRKPFDMVGEEDAQLAALGDILGRKAEPQDLRMVLPAPDTKETT